MKNKILFATTALVATASVAAADVTFSGYGRFGVKYTGSLAQSAANAAAAAEREAQALIQFDRFVNSGSGVTTAGEILDVEAFEAFEVLSLNGAALLDERVLSTADAVDTATDPFTSAYDAFDYAKLTATTQITRASGFITALKATDIADADALVYNTETGKVSAVATADIPAAAAAAGNVRDIAADAQVIADIRGGTAASPGTTAITAADTEAAIEAILLAERTEASTLALALNDFAVAETIMPAAIATDAILADTLITSRLRMNIHASTESDSGVTFGAQLRLQQDEGNTNAFNSARFYAKTGGLEIAVGNIYGVIDSMSGLYSGSVGLTGLGYANVVSNFASHGYSSGGAGSAGSKESAELRYSMGDYAVNLSHDGVSTEYGAEVSMSGWTVALSASSSDVATDAEWVATVGGSIGGVKVGLATAEAVNGNSSTTLSASFDVAAATSVTAYYNDDEANTRDDKSYGLGFSHGLGGGTSLVGGVASVNDQTIADFGVSFNF